MLLKGSLVIFASNWMILFLALFQSFLVIIYLGAEGRGNLVLFQSLYVILAVLLTFGMPTSSVYYFRQKIYSLATITWAFCLFSVLIMVFCAPLIYFNFGYLSKLAGFTLVSPISALLCVIAIGSLLYSNFSQSLLLSLGSAELVSLIKIGRMITIIIVTYVLCGLFNYDLAALITGVIVLELLSAMVATSIIVRNPFFGTVINLWKCFKSLVGYGLKSSFNPIIQPIQNNLTSIFIGRMSGLESVAYFSLAVSIYNGLNTIPKAVISLLFGVVADSEYKNPNMKVAKVASSLMYMMGLLGLILGVTGYFIIPLTFGSEFTQTLLPMYILLATVMFVSSGATLQTSFFVANKPHITSILSVVTGGFLMIFVFLGVSYLDIIGAAIAICFVRLTMYGASVVQFTRITQVPWIETIKLDRESLLVIKKLAKKYIKNR